MRKLMDDLKQAWTQGTPLKRVLMAGAPAAAVLLLIAGIAVAAMAGNGGDARRAEAEPTRTPRATQTPADPTPSVEDVLRYFAAVMGTPTAPAGGGGGGFVASGSGPGPILPTDMRLSIPKIGVDMAVHSRTMGTNGVMGDPAGAWQVIWYDFGGWNTLGGRPGEAGHNAVFSGHVDYIGVGPAVFYGLRNLAPGDRVTVTSNSGTFTYEVQWSEWVSAHVDFTSMVRKTGADSITLITCIGSLSGGDYSHRLVVRGKRV
jgi:LPXTG-site transpeptidase (sortase) family protein